MAKKSHKNLFRPGSSEPFKLSRSRLDLFVNCPRCFYLEHRLGIKRPSGPAFTLNTAVDALLKKEFDGYRAKIQVHPLMKKYDIDAVPYTHEDIDTWRANFKGISVLHKPTGMHVHGAVDDVWVNPDGSIIIVDYKATSTTNEISLDDEYKSSFKRQLEVYQWLFRQNGFMVDSSAYIVYANALKTANSFDAHLDFDMQIIKHIGDDSWVESKIEAAHACLSADHAPASGNDCPFCTYVELAKRDYP